MTNVTIGRYDGQAIIEADGTERPLSQEWAGWIEGTRDDGTSWITFLDGHGAPTLHWPNREASGAAIGDPIVLS